MADERGISSAMRKRLAPSKVFEKKLANWPIAKEEQDEVRPAALIVEWMSKFDLDSTGSYKLRSKSLGNTDRLLSKEGISEMNGKYAKSFQAIVDEAIKAGADKEQVIQEMPYELFRFASSYLAVTAKDGVSGSELRKELNRVGATMPEESSFWVTQVCAEVLKIIEVRAPEVGLDTLRRVAIFNMVSGKREFDARHVAEILLTPPLRYGAKLECSPECFIMWLHLSKNSSSQSESQSGIPLTKVLEAQAEESPGQYQFKHLSFQEALFAEDLVELASSTSGWAGWQNDREAAAFLNNPFMNNTCRIAGGNLGSHLARHRPRWDFGHEGTRLNEAGKQALWLVTRSNTELTSLFLAGNTIGKDESDSRGLAEIISTCKWLKRLSLAENELGTALHRSLELEQRLLRAFRSNQSLTELE